MSQLSKHSKDDDVSVMCEDDGCVCSSLASSLTTHDGLNQLHIRCRQPNSNMCHFSGCSNNRGSYRKSSGACTNHRHMHDSNVNRTLTVDDGDRQQCFKQRNRPTPWGCSWSRTSWRWCRVAWVLVAWAACVSVLQIPVAGADAGSPGTRLLSSNSSHLTNVSFAQRPEASAGLEVAYADANHVRKTRSVLLRPYHMNICSTTTTTTGSSVNSAIKKYGECMLAFYCVIAGGRTNGRCGPTRFHTCCSKLPSAHLSRFSLRSMLSLASGLPLLSRFGVPRAVEKAGVSTGAHSALRDDSVCGQTSIQTTLQRRIIGGDEAHFGEFPWQAHIRIGQQQCGGALINHWYVVTAGHCVRKTPSNNISVVLGTCDLHEPLGALAQTYRVTDLKLHPNFVFSSEHPDRFDVALLRLDRRVKYRDNIRPICLPRRGWSFDGWRATVAGWGKTDPTTFGRHGTRLLQKLEVPIIPSDECERWHKLRGIDLRVELEMMCAGYKEGKRDACVGDSGGPMMLVVNGRWTLVGITSAGYGCAESYQPGIYHQVSTTVDWIRANV